jgi:hypothetical protein
LIHCKESRENKYYLGISLFEVVIAFLLSFSTVLGLGVFEMTFFSKFLLCGILIIMNPVLVAAKVGEITHVTYVSKIRKSDATGEIWGASANVKTAAWIETFLTFKGSELRITHNFINDRKRKGYTGCVTLSVFGPKNNVIVRKSSTRGLKPTGWSGRRKRIVEDSINFEEIFETGGVSKITVRQYHCPSSRVPGEIVQGFKDLTKAFRTPPVTKIASDNNPQGVKSLAIENCTSDRSLIYLWYRKVGANSNFSNYGSFPTNWQSNTCPRGKIKNFIPPSKGRYEIRLVQPSSDFCKANDPNQLGCSRLQIFIDGDPSSSKVASARAS